MQEQSILPMQPQNILQDDEKMDLEHKAIERIKLASNMSFKYYGAPLVCTYSGGKDSDVMLELFKRSGIIFEVYHSLTTVDAPQTVWHIKEVFKELEENGIKCTIDKHEQADESGKKYRVTMWNLIPKRGIPTRMSRFCCSTLKESGCKKRMIATGVRWEESYKRKKRSEFEAIGNTLDKVVGVNDEVMLMNDNADTRRIIERCQIKGKTVCNPIIEWPDYDVWNYYRYECKRHNQLYEMGYDRVGCIGCPLASKHRYKEFSDFPTYERAYKRAFKKLIENRKAMGKNIKWKDEEAAFRWWMEDPNIEGQRNLFEDYQELISE